MRRLARLAAVHRQRGPSMVLSLVLALLLQLAPCRGSVKPHVLTILADDVGWANVGWNRAVKTREVATPHLDSLVAQGIELQQFYTFKYCSPTRSALQTGRNPIHVNVLNALHAYNPNQTQTAGYSGIALNFTTLPEKMRQAGWLPHAVGKWDCGGATLRQTPAGRGYESWLGYWSACNDYWNMQPKCGPATCTFQGTVHTMLDFWEQDRAQPPDAEVGNTVGAPYLSRPARALTNNRSCTQVNQQADCVFEDDILLQRAQAIVRKHASAGSTVPPLFLYWATHAAHGPREVPQATLDKFSFIDWDARKTYVPYQLSSRSMLDDSNHDRSLAFLSPKHRKDDSKRLESSSIPYDSEYVVSRYHALVNHLDALIGQILTTLRNETTMWNNTLIVFCSEYHLSLHPIVGQSRATARANSSSFDACYMRWRCGGLAAWRLSGVSTD